MKKKFELKDIFRNKFSKYIRNIFGIKPAHFLIDYTGNNISVSDAFFWRTDKNFKTIFKFTDILKFFYKNEDSEVEIIFFDKSSKVIKSISLKNIDLSNEIKIDKNFLDGLEDYGTFFLYHKSSVKVDAIVRNSCYTGYSYLDNLPSFVHGNTLTNYKSFDGKVVKNGIGGKSLISNQIYQVQKHIDSDKTEILIMNPCDSKIKVKVNDLSFFLNKGCSRLVKIINKEMITIKSNSYILRPIIFNFKGTYLDAHHG